MRRDGPASPAQTTTHVPTRTRSFSSAAGTLRANDALLSNSTMWEGWGGRLRQRDHVIMRLSFSGGGGGGGLRSCVAVSVCAVHLGCDVEAADEESIHCQQKPKASLGQQTALPEKSRALWINQQNNDVQQRPVEGAPRTIRMGVRHPPYPVLPRARPCEKGAMKTTATAYTCSTSHKNGNPPKAIISDQNHLTLRARHTQALGGGYFLLQLLETLLLPGGPSPGGTLLYKVRWRR